MPVTSIVTLTLKPESLADAERVVRESLELTRGFQGNLGVDVLVDQADPTRWLLIERWESEEADSAYRAYRAENGTRSALGPLLAGAPQVVKYDVSPA
ncbi:putative quinol monooxygenase [Agromyces sp. Marseille-P2726]|uniref:putative quinol monooxygenase n=1 Tax=Agromyces sp. Marseille-P2726 TaxID=2709132 RepID=UPI00156EF401|nr:putative quinol monooxygenase [Agromyces sp. Marseille-P2726]